MTDLTAKPITEAMLARLRAHPYPRPARKRIAYRPRTVAIHNRVVACVACRSDRLRWGLIGAALRLACQCAGCGKAWVP